MALQKIRTAVQDELRGFKILYILSCQKPEIKPFICKRYYQAVSSCIRCVKRDSLTASYSFKNFFPLHDSGRIIGSLHGTVSKERHFSNDSHQRDEFVDTLYKGITDGERGSLSRGITLIESTNAKKKLQAQQLLSRILQFEKNYQGHTLYDTHSFRIGKHLRQRKLKNIKCFVSRNSSKYFKVDR